MFDSDSVTADMSAVVERFKEEMKKVRTGRAHPDMLASVRAEVYGQMTPLNQIANVSVSGGTMLLVTPYDVANIAKISSAIRADQSLGLNPADDGRVIRVPVPPLTEERRKEIVKTASVKVEDAKNALRKIRDDMIKKFNTEIDKLFSDKEAEIMKI